MDGFLGARTHVGRLRVQGAGPDAAALRLALSCLLGGAELHPAGVSPSAVLIMRWMADPLPGRLAPNRYPIRLDPAWERAVQSVLAEAARHAAHPSQGAVPANAEAVLFADEAEMLACLALDLVSGLARQRWWWQAMLRGVPSPPGAALAALLCDHAASVPAALHHLAQRGEAVRVITALSPEQARAVLVAIVQAYRLPCSFDAPGAPEELPSGSRTHVRMSARHEQSKTAEGSVADFERAKGPPERPALPPWPKDTVPQGLGVQRAALLGVGLSLHRQPAAVRGGAFWRALGAWWAAWSSAAAGAEPGWLPPEAEPTAEGRVALLPLSREATARTRAAGPRAGQSPDFGSREGVEPAVAGRATTAVELVDDLEAGDKRDRAVESHLSAVRKALPESGQTDQPAEGTTGHDAVTQPSAAPRASLDLVGGVLTQLGGVLYLVNLMAWLDLPGCFESDWALASQVGAWGTLELLAQGLLAGAGDALAQDPLWAALAELDGREPGQPIGAGLQAAERYRLPAAWLAGAPEAVQAAVRWACRGGRLRVWSEAGYVLFDGPHGTSAPREQVAAELNRFGELASGLPGAGQVQRARFDRAPLHELGQTGGPAPTSLTMGLSPTLVGWLALVLPYVRLRLRQTLRLGVGDDLTTALLLRTGWLYVTSTHVDLVMGLEQISLPVRLAGLDQNPGWEPELGRVILLHFE